MAYIGNSPANVGNYQIIDDIKSQFDGTKTSFQLQVSAHNITPAKSGQLLVSINGVLQEPDDTGSQGFTISGTNIIFSSAPNTGAEFWGVFQGQNVDIGTPSFDTVDTVHIKDDAITDVKINSTKLDGIANNANKYIHPTSHTVSEVTGLQSALDGKIDDSQVLTNVPAGALFTDTIYTHPTTHTIADTTGLQSALDAKTTPGYVDTSIASLVDSAPATLNTLNELALALGDDANHVTTMTTLIGGKVSKGGDTVSGDIGFIDGAKAMFGDGNDLEIYHTGSTSYIRDTGDGNLAILGTNLYLQDSSGFNFIECLDTGLGGTVNLFHGGLYKKLATTSTGIDVTGSVISSGTTVIKNASTDSSGLLISQQPGDLAQITNYYNGALTLGTNNTEKMRIKADGNVGIGTSSPISSWLGGFDPSTGNSTFKQTTEGWITTPVLTGLAAYYPTQGARPIIWAHHGGTSIQSWDNDTADGVSIKSYEGTTRLFIRNDGNVGIGTTAPAAKLHVVGKSKFTDDLIMGQTSSRIDYDNGVSTGALRFWSTSGNTERMRITSAGNVGIGTTTPSAKLNVVHTSGDGFVISRNNKNLGFSANYSNANTHSIISSAPGMALAFATNGDNERMRIDSNGNVILIHGIKLGDDTRTASAAGAGTLRWNGNKLQTSDGTDWGDVNYVPPIGTESNPASSAQAILDAGDSTGDGIYYINLPNVGVTQVYCDMTTYGGGWMFAMRLDSTLGTGTVRHYYDSDWWVSTTADLMNGTTSNPRTNGELKTKVYAHYQHTEVMLEYGYGSSYFASTARARYTQPSVNAAHINTTLSYKMGTAGRHRISSTLGSYTSEQSRWARAETNNTTFFPASNMHINVSSHGSSNDDNFRFWFNNNSDANGTSGCNQVGGFGMVGDFGDYGANGNISYTSGNASATISPPYGSSNTTCQWNDHTAMAGTSGKNYNNAPIKAIGSTYYDNGVGVIWVR